LAEAVAEDPPGTAEKVLVLLPKMTPVIVLASNTTVPRKSPDLHTDFRKPGSLIAYVICAVAGIE
jgi:hypothetical protein